MNDFRKFANDKMVSTTYLNDYFKKLNIRNNTTQLIESNGMSVDIFSKLLDDRIIFLCTEIDSDICNIIKAQLMYLETQNDDDIKIYIDSPGGSVYSGLGLLDVMDYVSPDIITVNTGLAASMAAVILCSGSKGKRRALRRSRTMIHQPMTGFGSYAQATDIEIESREINSLKRELYEIISEKTGQNYDKVFKDGDRDYWMSSQDAKKYGMVDEIVQKRDSKKTKK
jgi:ATP-dependent Clp protease protease subunit